MNAPTQYAYLNEIPDTWWAYFGGLFTGEGCIQVRDNFTICMKIEMCDRAVCYDVKRHLGGAVRKPKLHGNQLQQPYCWEIGDPFLIFQILRKIRQITTGKKAKQIEATLRFVLLRLEYQQQRKQQSRQRYTATEKLKLVQVGRTVRELTGGSNKKWKQRWDERERELKWEMRNAKMQGSRQVHRAACATV